MGPRNPPRGKSDSEALRDDARWCWRAAEFLLWSFVKLVFCWCVQSSVCRSVRHWFFAMSTHELWSLFGTQITKSWQWILQLCSDKRIVYLFISFLGSDVNVETGCIVHGVNIHILICALNVREASDDWPTSIFHMSWTSVWRFCGRCFICWRERLCEWSMGPRHPRRRIVWV